MKTANTTATKAPKATKKAATAPKEQATKATTQAATAPKEQAPKATTQATRKAAKQPVKVPADTSWHFSATSLTVLGETFPATYSVAKGSGDIYAFATLDGEAVRVHLRPSSPAYHAAFEAAESAMKTGAAPAPKEQAEAKKAPAAPKEQATKATKPATAPKGQAKKAAKAATAPKEQPMSGKGWRIVEDNADGRIRVYLDANVSDAVKTAVVDGGFWWSPTKQAYSKRNNPRGMKAAAALAETLRAITK